MADYLFNYFLNPPARLKAFGRVVSGIGMALLVAGVYLNAGVGMIDAIFRRANSEGPTTLAAAYPGIPTWFIPEGFFGFLIAGVLLAGGLWAMHFARKVERLS